MNVRLVPLDRVYRRLIDAWSLERGLTIGLLMVAGGIGGSIHAVSSWEGAGFGAQPPQALMRIVVPSLTAILAGMEIVFASFFLSVLRLQHQPSRPVLDDV